MRVREGSPDFSVSRQDPTVVGEGLEVLSSVCNFLLNLDIKKLLGPDGVPIAFFKRYAKWCAKYLYVVVTRSLSDGSLPDDWRTAEIKPVHKSSK